jgi:hypothetical protein
MIAKSYRPRPEGGTRHHGTAAAKPIRAVLGPNPSLKEAERSAVEGYL